MVYWDPYLGPSIHRSIPRCQKSHRLAGAVQESDEDEAEKAENLAQESLEHVRTVTIITIIMIR